MTVTVTSRAYVEGHPNIRLAPRVERCGASAQHAASPHDPAYSDRCTDPGEWVLKGCARQYCTTHAAVIGRAKDRLCGGTNWCASRRDTAEPTSLVAVDAGARDLSSLTCAVSLRTSVCDFVGMGGVVMLDKATVPNRLGNHFGKAVEVLIVGGVVFVVLALLASGLGFLATLLIAEAIA